MSRHRQRAKILPKKIKAAWEMLSEPALWQQQSLQCQMLLTYNGALAIRLPAMAKGGGENFPRYLKIENVSTITPTNK